MVTAAAWTVALPFIANDVWRLLLARSNRRAALLRVAFAVATGLVTLGVLALVVELAQALAGGLWQF